MQKQTNPKPLGASMAKLVLVVAVIVCLGAVLGILGYVLIKQKPAVQNPPIAQKADETADWKTYRNEEYGFELKYPKNWPVYSNLGESGEAKTESIVFTTADRISLSIYRAIKMPNTGITQGNFEEVVKSYRKAYELSSESFKEEDIILDGHKGKKMSIIELVPFGDKQKNINILLDKDGEVWRIFLLINKYNEPNDNKYFSIFDQILSTFKFIGKDEIE